MLQVPVASTNRPRLTSRAAVALVLIVTMVSAIAPPASASTTTTTTTTAATTTTTAATTTTTAATTSSPNYSQEYRPGYWVAAADGGVYQFGTTNFGSMRGKPLNKPVVGMAAAPDGQGYWLVASDGGVFSFGSARFYGSTGNIKLNKPIVGMAATPGGHGYWLVASDGGVFSFGSARFYGSMGGKPLNKPVVGMAAAPDGQGYWLVASDGGVFSFGSARFYGSTGNIKLNKPIVGMAATGHGHGYWLVASDGGIFTFGGAPFYGSTGGDPGPAPVVAIASTSHANLYPPGATGYDVSQFQCPPQSLPPKAPIGIVQVSGGFIEDTSQTPPNPCFSQEAAWAGPNLSVYIFMDGLPSGHPSEAMTGPAGRCTPGSTLCESYNYGYYWANKWVGVARAAGYTPSLWWLDVEGPCQSGQQTAGIYWRCGTSGQPSNAQVVQGALAALHSDGLNAGVYSTNYQWGEITGSLPEPGMPTWVPTVPASRTTWAADCTKSSFDFAGGNTWLIQWLGGTGNGPYDSDIACNP